VGREYGITISPNHISNIKSGLGKKSSKKGKKHKHAAAQAVTASPAHNGAGDRGSYAQEQQAGGVSLSDIEVAQQLAERVGVRELHALIDLVAR
jgi:hypothetical protein